MQMWRSVADFSSLLTCTRKSHLLLEYGGVWCLRVVASLVHLNHRDVVKPPEPWMAGHEGGAFKEPLNSIDYLLDSQINNRTGCYCKLAAAVHLLVQPYIGSVQGW